MIHECFEEVKRLSDVPYPKSLTILNPVSNDMFVIIEGSTKVLKMIDTQLKEFLTQFSIEAQDDSQIRCIRTSCLNPREWKIGGANPIILRSERIVNCARSVHGLSQDPSPQEWDLQSGVECKPP